MIKVLHVIGSLNHGGVEKWLLSLSRHINRTEVHFDFCCLSGEKGEYADEILKLGFNVYPCKVSLNIIKFYGNFKRLVRDGQYDVIHSHVHLFSGLIVSLAKLYGVPIRVAHSHTTVTMKPKGIYRVFYGIIMRYLLAKCATLMLGVSRESLLGLKWKTRDPSRFRIVYCGIDVDFFERMHDYIAVRRQHGIPTAATVIGHVGRLTLAKNHQFLFEIFREYRKLEENTWLLIVGSGELSEKLRDVVNGLELKNVVFAGAQQDIPGYLYAMDCFVFPSLWEGLPVSVVEAQASGLPCLCSDRITEEVVVVPDLVRFASLDDGGSLWARKIQDMLNSRAIDGREAKNLIKNSKFSIRTNARILEELYKRELAEGSNK